MNALWFTTGFALVCAACSSGGSVHASASALPLDGSIDAAPVVAIAALGQVDRTGRPLVSLLLVPPSLKDEYNAQATFEMQAPTVLLQAVESRLEALDTLELGDGGPDMVDWPVPDGGSHPLLGMMTSDVLLLDPGRPSTGDAGFLSTYLDLERELYLGGDAHTTCGGRTPSDDVADTTLTLLVTGTRGVQVVQGVRSPTKPAATAFPYLAAAN